MQDVIHAVAGAGYPSALAQITLNKLDVVKNLYEIWFAASFKIVETANGFSALYKCLADPGAKESGAAGYEITSHISSMVSA